jgi:alkylhydroperoxidase family enzyme
MPSTEPRIRPLPRGTLPDDVRAALEGWLRPDATEVPAPLDTLVRHPELARAYLPFNRHLLFASTLPPRSRELVILRTAALCRSAFEREQHEIIGRREGLDEGAIARSAQGPDAPGWSPGDAALVRATDELLSGWTISDATWAELRSAHDERQLMDLPWARMHCWRWRSTPSASGPARRARVSRSAGARIRPGSAEGRGRGHRTSEGEPWVYWTGWYASSPARAGASGAFTRWPWPVAAQRSW